MTTTAFQRMAFDAFFYEAFDEEVREIERLRPRELRFGYFPLTIQESGHDQPTAPIVSIRTQSRIPPSWPPKLSAVLTRSTGYDHLLASRAENTCFVPCGYLPLYCVRAVAEQAALLWMALLRRLSEQMTHFDSFNRDGLTGKETAGRTLLVVGVGNIGYEVVRIGQALEMHVLGVDLVKRHDDVDYVTIHEGLAAADVIVCAMSLNPTSFRYFNYERLQQARRGVVFVNVARGEMSPAADLLRLLEEGHLGGVGLDVFDEEDVLAVLLRQRKVPDTPNLKALLAMRRNPRVIFTPHNAFNTEEAVKRKAEQSIEQIIHFMEHGTFKWPIPS